MSQRYLRAVDVRKVAPLFERVGRGVDRSLDVRLQCRA